MPKPQIEEFEDKHGVLCYSDGHDTIRGLFRELESEADDEGVIARGHVAVTRFADGTFAVVLSKSPIPDEVVRGYLELVSNAEE